MLPEDKRSVDHQTLEYLRKLAVTRVKAGERPSVVGKSLGFCRTSIYRWIRAESQGGEEALNSRKAPGPTPKLTDKQKQQVIRWIVGKDPRQYGFDFGLWTRHIVGAMIADRFGVSLTLPCVGALLASLGITPQKPLRRAYERDPAAIEHWKHTVYPSLRRRARRERADIFFLDETGVRSDCVLGRTYGLRGKTPVVQTSGRRQAINAISAVSPRGGFWFQVYRGMLNAARFIEMLSQLMKGRRRKVILILDGLPAHKAKSVAQYVQSRRGRLELHFLPPYAPDLNPDEFVWHHLKQNGTAKKPLKKDESLEERVIEDLQNIQEDAQLVKSFFKAESVAYAIY
jgi:transposase